MSESVTVGIERRRPAAMWNVRGSPNDADFMREAEAAFGVALPQVANTASGDEHTRALWLGPDEWLIVSSRDLPADMRASNGTLVDVSHGRTVLRVSGRYVRDVLASACALDLDPRVFPLNACAQTAMSKINILLDHVQPDVFDLYCPRSYHASFSHWLTEAAAEYK